MNMFVLFTSNTFPGFRFKDFNPQLICDLMNYLLKPLFNLLEC
jgi:hypothetical protein